jgi:D-alanyl-D-alanine carboxypeptidase/D-alanyl-D-alanine-endopeptidase (penicillin-binding protein 4)
MEISKTSAVLPPLLLAVVLSGLVAAPYQNESVSSLAPLTEVELALLARETEALEPPAEDLQELRRDLEQILTSTGNRQGRWAVLAISMDLGDTLLALNPGQLMIPASNMKLLSTAAALHYLGPDFKSRTFLLADGVQTGEVLDGDLVLFGTGDPTLSERYYPSATLPLDSLAAQIASAGIREIRGNLVVDGTFFGGPDRHPEWKPGDLNDPFAAPISALSLAENVVTVRIEAGGWVGAQPSVFTIPEAAGIPVANSARTLPAGSRSRVWLDRAVPHDPIGIIGEIPLGGAPVWRRLPVPDPLEFSGHQMMRSLQAQGIRVTSGLRVIRSPEESPISGPSQSSSVGTGPSTRILAELESPPLIDILRPINKESNNFLAETVARLLGRAVVGDGSFSGGGRAVEKFLVEVVGVNPSEVRVRDGSGLSDQNQASPQVFVKTLEYMATSPHWVDFLDTLPEAGVRRELGRMYRSPAAGNLRAKTGTMDSVSALSGIVQTRTGERVLFSILSNEIASEYGAKRAEDQLGIRLASLSRPLLDGSLN